MFVPTWEGKRTIPIVSACMTREGLPTFALNTIEVTADEATDGVHFYLVEADLLEAGFEEPFVHFPVNEAPAFLHPSVRAHLALASSDAEVSLLATAEES
jgi:hypothetical protein